MSRKRIRYKYEYNYICMKIEELSLQDHIINMYHMYILWILFIIWNILKDGCAQQRLKHLTHKHLFTRVHYT